MLIDCDIWGIFKPGPNWESLPLVLVSEVLRYLPTLNDLRAVVTASPNAKAAYDDDKRRVLLDIMTRQFGTEVMLSMYFHAKAAQFRASSTDAGGDNGVAEAFLTLAGYGVRNKKTVLRSCTLEDVIRMQQNYIHVVRLAATRIFAGFLRELPLDHRPTVIEERRILCALYRLDIWAMMFSEDYEDSRDDPRTRRMRPARILHLFFGLFHPWEAESVACVHEYLASYYNKVFWRIKLAPLLAECEDNEGVIVHWASTDWEYTESRRWYPSEDCKYPSRSIPIQRE